MVGNAKKALTLSTPVQYLKGVGPARAVQLERLQIRCLGDLIHHYPFDYLNPSASVPLAHLKAGERVTTTGILLDVQNRRIQRRRSLLTAILADGPARLRLSWFNAAYLEKQLIPGRKLIVSGDVSIYARQLQMVNPQFEADEEGGDLSEGRPQARYSLTAGLKQGNVRGMVRRSLENLLPLVEDPLRPEIRQERDLMERADALRGIHLPRDPGEIERARRRLAFDEALGLQLAVGIRRNRLLRRPAEVVLEEYGQASAELIRILGFSPTNAQRRVLAAIGKDLRGKWAMHRLVQGDVGSGKTLVALIAMIWILEAGAQAAFMAPTEVLARQHGNRQGEYLQELGFSVATLTGSSTAAERRTILRGLKSGEIQAVFGTHALIQEKVEFQGLGLAVVDEQHRFGVLQRATLSGRGAHVLVMSATPIPRSLALTVYGDLDLSIIDELPPGRTPVETRIVKESGLDSVYEEIHRRARKGERGYLVYPLVEESDALDLQSATEAYEELTAGIFADLRVALLHGRLSPSKKAEISEAFARGDLDVLISTTVVEVGLDVPEATTMMIHEAERFGLAQLHQLRGRVGRGSRPSHCILVESSDISPGGRRRLQQLAATRDGFRLAEMDLKERGMGDLQGIRQHGELPFKLLHPMQDIDIVQDARSLAQGILKSDPSLSRPEHAPLARWLQEMGQRNPLWSSAG